MVAGLQIPDILGSAKTYLACSEMQLNERVHFFKKEIAPIFVELFKGGGERERVSILYYTLSIQSRRLCT